MDLTYWWLVFSVLTMLFDGGVHVVLRDCCATNPFRRYDQLHG